MNNNKSTIIGWVLIFAVMVGFIYLNQPSEEQLAEQARMRAMQDSIATVEAQKQLDESMAEARYNQTLLQDSTSTSSFPVRKWICCNCLRCRGEPQGCGR